MRQYHSGGDFLKHEGVQGRKNNFFFSNDTQVTHPFLSLCSKFSCINLDISDLGTHWSAPQGGCPFVSRHRSVQAAAPPGHLLPEQAAILYSLTVYFCLNYRVGEKSA